MRYIHRLPFLCGGFMAVLAGLVSYANGMGNKTIYLRMAIFLIVFYIIGIIAKNSILKLFDEISKKEEEEEKAAAEAEKQQKQQETKAQQSSVSQDDPVQQGRNINLVADDTSDEFSPMTLSRVISSEIKKD